MTDAKRRALAQKIGKQGELIFEQWATAGGFSASKLQDDFGVDYVCQQMLPTSKGSEEVTGLSVLVQVRATSTEKTGKTLRIGFSREDVETAMRQGGVFCVAAVHMPTAEVRFRWLDIALLEQWASFLKSERDSISMRLDSMSEGVDRFSRELVQVSRPSQRARFMKTRTKLHLEEVIPGALLYTNSGALGDWAAVVVPNLMSIVNATADRHEALATAMFRPIPFSKGFGEVLARHQPHAALLSVADLVEGPLWVAGGAESEVTLQVEHGDDRVLSTFLLRRVRDERAYIGASGLVLRITDSRADESRHEHVHYMSWSVEQEGAKDLVTSGQLAFLRMLRPGASLNEEGRPLIPIDHFGVERLGRSIEVIEQVFAHLGLPLSSVMLSDLADEIFAWNLGVLEAILDAGNRPVIPTFVLGLGEDEEISEEGWEPCNYRVPITLKMKQHSLLAWLEGAAEAYVHDGSVRGFRFLTKEKAEVAATDLPIEDARAMVHVHPGWPPLIIGGETPAIGEWGGGPVHGHFFRAPNTEGNEQTEP